MKKRILVLGAGFGGLELCTMLSEAFADGIEVTLIDENNYFLFRFLKARCDVRADDIRRGASAYRKLLKPGVRFLPRRSPSIDPAARRVTTNRGTHEADFLVVALGADYDFAKTPGWRKPPSSTPLRVRRGWRVRGTFRGAMCLSPRRGPFKCPPAPSEAALMMHDYLTTRSVRGACEITLILPLEIPIPHRPNLAGVAAAFAERNITFVADRELTVGGRATPGGDPRRRPRFSYDLFLGVPAIRAPKMLEASGMTEDGYVPVKPGTLETRFPDVYAVGDGAAGHTEGRRFCGGRRARRRHRIDRRLRDQEAPVTHAGTGVCYIEFGGGRIGRVEVDFFSNPDHPTGTYHAPSVAMRANKEHFGRVVAPGGLD